MWVVSMALAGAAEPCLDRECLFCLLGEPTTSSAVAPAIERYGLNPTSDELFGGRGVSLGFDGGGRVSTVVHTPQQCRYTTCEGGVPFDLSEAADRAAVEAALPGGAWATEGGRTRWSVTRDELVVTVQVDDAGRVQRVEVGAAGSVDAVRAAWCRDGAWPGVRRADGAAVAGEPLAPPPAPDVMVGVVELWEARFRAAPEGSAERDYAWSMVEAADRLRSASRDTLRSAEWMAVAANAADNAAAREPYLNARADLNSVAWSLGEAARHLRAAGGHAERAGLTDAASRAGAHMVEVEALQTTIQTEHDALPAPDVVAISKTDVIPLMPAMIAWVLRFDARIAEIGLAL